MSRNTLVDTPFHYIVHDFKMHHGSLISTKTYLFILYLFTATNKYPDCRHSFVYVVSAGTLLGVEFSLAYIFTRVLLLFNCSSTKTHVLIVRLKYILNTYQVLTMFLG